MLTPSTAHLWVNCSLAGSLLGTQPMMDARVESDSRREGTCAHWAAELLLTGQVDSPHELVGQQHKNGWVVDKEMAHHVAEYRDYVEKFGPVVCAEKPIDLWDGLIKGRLDTSSSTSDTIRIFDFKYGWKLVEPTNSYDLLCYALAEWMRSQGQIAIEMHVYQPRPHHPQGPARVWRIERENVQSWASWLYNVADETRGAAPRANVGSQCDRCPAAKRCHALAATTYAIIDRITDTTTTNHGAGDLGGELRFLEFAESVIKARASAVREEAIARIKKGEMIPGACLEPRRANRQWMTDAAKLEMILGRPVHKPVLMSPSEIEREGVSKDIVAELTFKPSTGVNLSLDPTAYAEKMFGKAVK